MVSPNHLSPSVQGGVGFVVLQATQGRPVLKVVESEFSPSLCFSLLSPSLPVCLIMYEFVLECVYFISCYHQLLIFVPTSTHALSELYLAFAYTRTHTRPHPFTLTRKQGEWGGRVHPPRWTTLGF